MESFKSIYKVTEEFIENNQTFLMEEDNNIMGFYSIVQDDRETSLEYFYIEPEKIGKGYGRLMWNHAIDFCREENINEIILVTSPQAKEFYIKMGAVLIGEVDSLVIKDRKIPKLIYEVE
jgi:GNAT superfamily N-acetyltransferase